MGNLESSVSGGGVGDASILSEVHIDESPILSSPGCWTLHHAQVHEDDEDDGGGGGGGGGGADGDAADASGEEDLNQKGGRNRRSREQFSVFVSKASKKSGSATLEPLGKVHDDTSEDRMNNKLSLHLRLHHKYFLYRT